MLLFLNSSVAVFAVVLSTYITSRLAYGRSGDEKLRDLRQETYSYIVTRLSRAKNLCPEIYDNVFESITEDYRHPILTAFYGDIRAVFDRYSNDSLICSLEFVELFERFDQKLQGNQYDSAKDTFNWHAQVLTEFAPKLSLQARKEVNPKSTGGIGQTLKRRLRKYW